VSEPAPSDSGLLGGIHLAAAPTATADAVSDISCIAWTVPSAGAAGLPPGEEVDKVNDSSVVLMLLTLHYG